MRPARLRVVSATTLAAVLMLLPVAPATALQLVASTNVTLPFDADQGIVPQDDDFVIKTVPGQTATTSAALGAINYAPSALTTAAGTAHAFASETDLGVSTSLTITDNAVSLLGELGYYANASATLRDSYTLSGGATLFASSVFRLAGTMTMNSFPAGGLAATITFRDDFGVLFEHSIADALSETLSIEQVVAAPAVSAADLGDYRVTLNALVQGVPSEMTFGDHAADIDFDGTATFVGFALFEDAAMTMPVTAGVTITAGSGASIPVVAVVPLPISGWLLVSGIVAAYGAGRTRLG